jgi:PHP family Zn ribbon phosphoesterase
MGMRDESWCNSCGTSIPYTEEEDYNSYCGECSALDAIDTILHFVESRIKDLSEKRDESQLQGDYENDDYIAGAIDAYDIVRMKLSE